LGKLGAFNAASLAVLSDLLKDQSPEVRGAAAQALALAGPAAQPRLSRLLTEKDSHAKKNNPAKTEAAMLLAKIAPDHKGIFEILSNELQRQGCSNKKPLASSLCLLGPVGKTYVQSQFIKCLSSADRSAIPTYLSILTQAAPLTEQSQNALLLLTEGTNFPVKAKFKVFEHGPQFGIGSEKLIPILIRSLKEKEAYSITRTLKLLGALGSEAKAAVPELLRFWQDQEQASPFRSLAALALLRIDPETIDLNAFFNEELKEDRLESIQEAISAIGADRALPVLTAILESGNLEQQLQTLRCLGRLGQAAASTAPHLLKLHKSTHPKINYEAVLALINIGVSDTAVEERLAQLLLTDDWRRLQRNRNLPANIKPLLEQLRSSGPCSLVRFRSNLLLRRIFHERGHQAS
ncbi:MAG: hypothetical protein GX589_00645, partial [Deltaproteobacteria bacterium]|nr:hypothetical protein [Deltaproteobacteria bacterium]